MVGKFIWNSFYLYFYHKESQAGYLLLVVLKQNIYSLIVWLVPHIGKATASKQLSCSCHLCRPKERIYERALALFPDWAHQ